MQNDLGDKLKKRFGMTLPQFQVLAQLASHPDGMTMSALSKSQFFSNGNTTGIIERMRRECMVETRGVKGDKRAKSVMLSEIGWKKFNEIMAEYQIWVDGHFEMISEENAEMMINELRQIRENKQKPSEE